jgi:pimeloyl-ACP methyl ester carboxylesterase
VKVGFTLRREVGKAFDAALAGTRAEVQEARREFLARAMEYDTSPKPLEGEILDFDVPIFFFLGRYDHNTPSQLAAGYLERLQAPIKELVWFEGSAHFPFLEEPARFHSEMLRIDKLMGAYWASR